MQRTAPNFPSDLECTKQSAHGHIDEHGDYYNVFSCLTKPSSEYGSIPLVAYLPFKIHGDNIQPDDDIVSSMIFGIAYFNQNRRDYKTRIFHSIAITQNFLIVPENSLVMPSKSIIEKTINGEPIIETYEYDTRVKGAFAIISKNTLNLKERIMTDKERIANYTSLV